jgi:competence protein ComEC
MMPSMPPWAFGLMVAGGLWLCLWSSRLRLLGLAPVAIGALAALSAPTPDLLVTGDGRHLVVLDANGTPRLLRDRAGDYVRDLLAEASGYEGDPPDLAEAPFGRCSLDSCVAAIRKGKTEWRLLATLSSTRVDWADFTAACTDADIVVSDRRLPRGCNPRWLKLDRTGLARSGGVAVYLGARPKVSTVAERVGEHPWGFAMR